ncbi:MAG: hypothetical protein ABFC63_07680 [Thermoguttaceae bacterium]
MILDRHVWPRNRAVCAGLLAFALIVADLVRPAFGDGQLATLREDVRTANPGDPSPPASSDSSEHGSRRSASEPGSVTEEDLSFGALLVGGMVVGGAVTSPLWVPHKLLDDDFSIGRSFAQFPYDNVPGSMTIEGLTNTKSWGAQLSTDYATGFDDLKSVGGHLIFSTASRFGADLSARDFQERLSTGQHDWLWLGDANLVFCFARNETMQWRTGLGINWLDDAHRTDVGFNFTYGFDWFPRKPWVVSTEIDWGNLGRSGLFHFRSTAGVMVNRFEAYTGYEYYDFDRVHTNALIAGVRVWF